MAAAILAGSSLSLVGLPIGAASVAGAAGTTGTAGEAPQATGDCPAAFPVSDLTAGMPVSGKTVEKGTTADPFTGTITGVLDDGIAPGIDMIIAQVDSPALQRAGGVWAGMSGSPVYAADGRLIGAVAYTLAGSTPIAGITPAADMYTLLSRPGAAATAAKLAKKVDLPATVQRRIVAAGAATQAEAASGLRPLPVPLGVSGLSPARMAKATEQLESRFPGTRVYAAGPASGGSASPSDIFPGSNFAAAISYGDFTIGGVGTTTAVCTVGGTNYALAFGHPFQLAGATTMSTHAANAVFVQPDPIFGPFKASNLGGIVGTLDQDRLTGIRSALGAGPTGVPLTSAITLTDDGTSRTGTTRVNLHEFLPTVGFFDVLNGIDRATQRLGGGTSQLRWVIHGTRASGAPFTVDVTNMYADQGDISFASVADQADMLDALDTNRFDDAKITGVDYTASVSSTYTQYTLDKVFVRRGDGRLVAPSADHPLQVAAGSRLNLRVVLAPYRNVGPVRNVDLSVVVPADTAGGFGTVDVAGGLTGSGGETTEPTNFDQLLAQLNGFTPNNSVTGTLQVDADGPSGPITRTTTARQLTDKVVAGETTFQVDVVPPRGAHPAVVDGNTWKLRSALSGGPATSTFGFGAATDKAVMGDWNGDGTLTPAVFRNGTWIFRAATGPTPASFVFGQAGDLPVVGDWNGDGRDEVGVFRAGHWYLRNSLTAGPADTDFTFGAAGDRPVAGDWDGDGVDTVGTFSGGTWRLRFANAAGAPDRTFGFGRAGDTPVTGEWDGDGRDEVGVYRAGHWYLRNTLSSGPSNEDFTFGGPGNRPVVWG